MLKNSEYKDYLKWRKKNITVRGIKDFYADNNGHIFECLLGDGLYTAPLSNKSMSKVYGDLYFVYNAIPKKPLIVRTLMEWQDWYYYKLIKPYYKTKTEFNQSTNIKDEMIKLGYDGVIIPGREMVNYAPENVLYFNNETSLIMYWEDNK